MSGVTIGDVARLAGVTPGTVSNTLNHPNKVRESTRNAVETAIRELGYTPNQNARAMARGNLPLFGLVLPRFDHAFSLQIENGAQSEAALHGYDILIAGANNNDILQERHVQFFLGTQVAGLLVEPMATPHWQPAPPDDDIPTVYLDIHSAKPGHYVAPDNVMQGRMLASHALDLGARHIAVIGKQVFKQLEMRSRGIVGVMATRPDVTLEFIDEGGWNSRSDGHELGRRLAERPKALRPDFLICLTDMLAAGSIEGVLDAGLHVPDDIRIAGCDGNQLAWDCPIPMTTFTPYGFEIARQGVRMLLEMIGKRTIDPAERKQVLIEPVLMPRASTLG